MDSAGRTAKLSRVSATQIRVTTTDNAWYRWMPMEADFSATVLMNMEVASAKQKSFRRSNVLNWPTAIMPIRPSVHLPRFTDAKTDMDRGFIVTKENISQNNAAVALTDGMSDVEQIFCTYR